MISCPFLHLRNCLQYFWGSCVAARKGVKFKHWREYFFTFHEYKSLVLLRHCLLVFIVNKCSIYLLFLLLRVPIFLLRNQENAFLTIIVLVWLNEWEKLIPSKHFYNLVCRLNWKFKNFREKIKTLWTVFKTVRKNIYFWWYEKWTLCNNKTIQPHPDSNNM